MINTSGKHILPRVGWTWKLTIQTISLCGLHLLQSEYVAYLISRAWISDSVFAIVVSSFEVTYWTGTLFCGRRQRRESIQTCLLFPNCGSHGRIENNLVEVNIPPHSWYAIPWVWPLSDKMILHSISALGQNDLVSSLLSAAARRNERSAVCDQLWRAGFIIHQSQWIFFLIVQKVTPRLHNIDSTTGTSRIFDGDILFFQSYIPP